MNLRKLPPSMVLALGLVACGDDGSQESEAGPCLSIDPTEVGSATDTSTGSGSDSSGSSSGTTGGDSGTASSGSSGADTTFGPCLDIRPTGSDTGTGGDSGSGSGSSGGMGVDEPVAPSRAEVTERVLERGTLPADVAARLRALTEKR